MLSVISLKEQTEILKKTRARLVEKITQLALADVTTAAGGLKFQIQQELAEANQVLEKLDQQLYDTDAILIYHALLEMDYSNQSDAFESYLNAQRISAFLIHGPQDYGHDWLLRRLMALVPREHDIEKIEIDLGSASMPKHVSALWDDLANRIYPNPIYPEPSFEQIAQDIAKWLETKTLLLILRQIDAWEPTEAQALITNFWQALAGAAREKVKFGNTRLVLFLVDYRDIAHTWDLPLADASSSQIEPGVLIRLQDIKLFTPKIVDDWIESHRVMYNDLLRPLRLNKEQMVEAILNNSQGGVPDQVARAICKYCNRSYRRDRWLNI